MNTDLLYIESQLLCVLLAAVVLKFGVHSANGKLGDVAAVVWLTLVASAADILRVVFKGNAVAVGICSTVYLSSFGFAGWVWFNFCRKQFGIKSEPMKWISLIPAVCVAFLAATSAITGWIYIIDQNGVFCRGNFYYAVMINYIYVIMAIGDAFCASGISRNRREGRSYVQTALCAVPVLLSAVQIIWISGGLSTITYTVMFAVIIVQSNLQHRQMVIDNLTRLPNRYGMDDEIEEQLQQYKKDKNDSFYIIACDMDNFKTINDTWGHPEGDRALRLIADALSGVAHNYDAEVFRIGGDEFVIITNTSESGLADKVCADVKTELDRIEFRDDFDICMSMGVSLYDGSCTIPELINGADKKLYQAKKLKSSK